MRSIGPGFLILSPVIATACFASVLGFWFDRRRTRSSRETLLSGDPERARATVRYFVEVQDSST